MSIKFLTSLESSREFDKTTYFDNMSSYEIDIRTKGRCDTPSSIRQLYKLSVLDWNQCEATMIYKCMKLVFRLMLYKYPPLGPVLPSLTVGFIKMSDGHSCDWGWPYTIGSCIVLSEGFLKHALDESNKLKDDMKLVNNSTVSKITGKHWNTWRPHMNGVLDIMTTLCHEVIHILQRHGSKSLDFEKFYRYVWNFRKIDKSRVVGNYFKTVTNPDGYNFEWIVNIDGKWLLPLLIFDINNQPEGIICEVYLMPSGYIQMLPNWTRIKSYLKYKRYFYDIDQIYHPNEIFAVIMSNWMIRDRNLADEATPYAPTPDGQSQSWKRESFYTGISKYL